MAELVFFRRGDEVLRIALESYPQRVVLGRGEHCDVVIPDPTVSRQQVALRREGDGYVLEDLSGKGTVVDGTAQTHAALTDGIDLAFGQWRAVFRQRAGQAEGHATQVGAERTVLHPTAEAGEAASPTVQLRVRRGAQESTLKLVGESWTLGKAPENDLVVDDPFVSSRHLKLTRRGARFQLTDLGSTNGTFVGPLRITDAELPVFTTFRLGDAELTLEPVTASRRGEAYEGIIGKDASIRQLTELIERVAPSNAAVAVFGESGTGKELVAQALHNRSTRADKPFIPVNCAAISKELIESELFGHEKGAFTGAMGLRKGAFEEADGGTLFLDEIGELPLDLQAKLLRALESGEIKRVGASRPVRVDVRLVTATNRDLLAAARQGSFREDLYYRLCVVPIHLSPLRNRRGDVLAIAEAFVTRFAPEGQAVRLTPAAVERLKMHAWPGNIRELRNVVHRALLLRKGPMIDAADLSFDTEVNADVGVSVPSFTPGLTLEQMMDKLERQIVENALKQFDNNKERVARELGVARSTFFKKLKDWGLTQKDESV